MFVTAFELSHFRNYDTAQLDLGSGINVFVGANGQGKTNLVEALEYLSTASSHRVSNIVPLIQAGHDSAIIRAKVQAGCDDDRTILLELEISQGKQNQARFNRAPMQRPRDLVGMLRTIVFSPMDLAIVRGDPSDRRRWIDSLVLTRWPRMAGVKQDFERALKQRNALLKGLDNRIRAEDEISLQIWNEQTASLGAELLQARLDTLSDVAPHAQQAYEAIAPVNNEIGACYRTAIDLQGIDATGNVKEELANRILAKMAELQQEELRRGVTLVGPHRDDIDLSIGALPAKGYASHGESWSFALALRLGGFELVRSDGTEPVLVLDDVFAELDSHRRHRLAKVIKHAEQVLITAAVGADVPEFPVQRRFRVEAGHVQEEP